jgi:flavin-dependent dehydrogenase
MENQQACSRLASASVAGKWLTTGPLTFGPRRLSRNGVIAIGDASGMIDPFTGTGIQMALRTGEMAADAVIVAFGRRENSPFETALARYRESYGKEFRRRMRVAGLLRGAAFSPAIAGVFAGVLARAPSLARLVLRATRSGNGLSAGPPGRSLNK